MSVSVSVEYIDNELKDENVTNIKEYIETYGKNMLVFFYLDDLLLELNKRGFKPLITSASHVKINVPLNHKEYFKLHDMEIYRDWETDRKSTRLNSSHSGESRMPSSA